MSSPTRSLAEGAVASFEPATERANCLVKVFSCCLKYATGETAQGMLS